MTEDRHRPTRTDAVTLPRVLGLTSNRAVKRAVIRLGMAVLAFVLLGAAVGCSGSDGGSTTTQGTTPATAGTDPTSGDQPIGPEMTTSWSGVRTDGDGLVIVFLGNPVVSDPPGRCQSDYQGIATETDQAVTVTVYGTDVQECPDQIQYGRTVRVALDGPLGSREVRNGAGGDPQLVFDGSRLRHPTWLPDGWEQTGDRPSEPGTGPASAAWQLAWSPPLSQGTSCGGEVSPIDLTVGGPTLLQEPWVTSFVTLAPTTVSGHPAEQARFTPAENPNATSETMIRWSDGDQTYVLRSATACPTTDQPASFDVLQRLADGLR